MWFKNAVAHLLTLLLIYYIANYYIGNYAYGVVLIFVIGLIFNQQEKKKVIAFFLRRQVGTIDDIARESGLERENILKHLKSLEEEGRLEILIPSPRLYKWTEERSFIEGMTSKEIKM